MTEQPPSAPGQLTEAEVELRRRALSDDEMRDLADNTRQSIDELRLRYINTNNPVYAWRAVNLVRMLNQADPRHTGGRMELPDWVRNYLSIAARRICDLADGMDYREAPAPFGEWPVDPVEPWDKVVKRVNSRKKTLSPGAAMKMVLSALELQRQGSNMFAVAEDLRRAELTESYAEMLMLTEGLSQEEAIGKFVDHALPEEQRLHIKGGQTIDPSFYVADARGVKKRLARARKARKDGVGGNS